jgi:Glycosyl transferases group 1
MIAFHPTAESDGVARILIVSMRNHTRHVWRCASYEFEDTIRACDAADLLAPVPRVHSNRIIRRVWRAAGRAPRLVAPMPAGRQYDLLLALCQNRSDIRRLAALNDVADRCRLKACFLEEIWAADVHQWREELACLRDFDAVFTFSASSVVPLSEVLERPCHFIPGAVDALKFCPYPDPPVRGIDVYGMGRRMDGAHRTLMHLAEGQGWFYLYDTVANFSVIDPAEHRGLLSSLVKRSRFFIACPSKFNEPQATQGQEELGLRYFEGIAGGAVVLGRAPRCKAYEQNFDWPDAVVPLKTTDGSDIADVIAELDRQPDRVAQVRRENVVNSLLRHDWVYRWRAMLDIVGLPPSDGISVREMRLKRLAQTVL